MSHLLYSPSKIKIEYYLKIEFKDNSIRIINGKTPYFDLKNILIKTYQLNPFFRVNDDFFASFFEDKITKIDLKGIQFINGKFEKINVIDKFLYNEREINYCLKDFSGKKSISSNTIQNLMSDKIFNDCKEKKLSNDCFIQLFENKIADFLKYYNYLVNSDEEYLNVFPSKFNLSNSFRFLEEKDIYDAIDFFQEEYINELIASHEETQMIYGNKQSKYYTDDELERVINFNKEMHRTTDAYKRWKAKKEASKTFYKNSYKKYNDRWDDDVFSNNDNYGERYCSYCMETPCQCSDNSDYQ